MAESRPSRRNFLSSVAGLAWSGAIGRSIIGAENISAGRPSVSNPRATDGDDRYEPNWDKRFELSVGQSKGDLVGKDDKVLQAAVDYVARLGGGTVRVLPGTYTLRNAVFLPSNIRVIGSGPETVITKIPSETIELAADSDWYDQELTLRTPSGFKVGDGVALMAKNASHGGQIVIKRTLVAQSGNRFKLNDGLRENLWLTGKPTCSSLFPLFTSERTADVVIENLTLDGNGKNNQNFNGNYGGCIFLQDCNRYTIRNVETHNYNGDGISFQICHDVIVENCHSHDNNDLGVHPGSGSQRPLIRNNRLERNDQGIFWCWGVKYGLAENNQIHGNRSYGISIGHCDTDNFMRNNHISESGKIGVLFRNDPRGQDFWANRNVLEGNVIENSGGDEGIAIDITGKTKSLRIFNNQLKETRNPMGRTGIRIGNEVGQVELNNNSIEGFAQKLLDQRQMTSTT